VEKDNIGKTFSDRDFVSNLVRAFGPESIFTFGIRISKLHPKPA